MAVLPALAFAAVAFAGSSTPFSAVGTGGTVVIDGSSRQNELDLLAQAPNRATAGVAPASTIASVYTPPAFALDDAVEVLRLLEAAAFGHLVTTASTSSSASTADTPPGFQATALPFLVDDDLSSVRAHVARANRQWRAAAGAAGLLIVPVSDAYISPRWYPSKREHGRVVPTWNYEVVHLHGTIEVHDDEAWLRQLVSDLTDHNERQVTEDDGTPAWHVGDAPADFIDKQLRAIVGLELRVSSIEAKQKLSQNRDEPDRRGATDGLGASNRRHDREISTAMSRLASDS